jgi:isopentenyldiphosphate isomerase
MIRVEYFDIYNENMEHLGIETRSEVHQKGYWHTTFQCWLVCEEEGKYYILFQKRHKDKDTYPNLLDITAAGHLKAGEKISDGVRELEEELGISVNYEELVPIEVIKEKKVEDHFIDAEFANVFLYNCNIPMEQLKLQEDEVVGIFKADITKIKRLFKQMEKYMQIQGYEIDYLGKKHEIKLRVQLKDFVPHKPLYYMEVFKAVEKFFNINNGGYVPK